MNKHTPGPWVVRHDDMVYSQEGRIIADCESTPYDMRPAPPIVEDKANAALIAAAPTMYEALTIALQIMIDKRVPYQHEIDQARAALAQAAGRGRG